MRRAPASMAHLTTSSRYGVVKPRSGDIPSQPRKGTSTDTVSVSTPVVDEGHGPARSGRRGLSSPGGQWWRASGRWEMVRDHRQSRSRSSRSARCRAVLPESMMIDPPRGSRPPRLARCGASRPVVALAHLQTGHDDGTAPRHGSAVDSSHEPFTLQFGQVAPDRLPRDLELLGQVGHIDSPLLEHAFHDLGRRSAWKSDPRWYASPGSTGSSTWAIRSLRSATSRACGRSRLRGSRSRRRQRRHEWRVRGQTPAEDIGEAEEGGGIADRGAGEGERLV